MTAKSCFDELEVILQKSSAKKADPSHTPIARVGQLIKFLQSGNASTSQKLLARKTLTGFTELLADKRAATSKQRARERDLVIAAIAKLRIGFR